MKKHLFSILFIIILAGNASAEIVFSGGYLNQSLSTSSADYNKFLKERYGAESISLTGDTLSIQYRKSGSKWGFGLESDTLSGNIKYTSLNNETLTNKMELTQNILFLAIENNKMTWTFGFGSNKLTRTFYGYQSAGIVTSNISSNSGSAESSTTGSVILGQGMYRLFGNKFSLDVGGRYSISNHVIPSGDMRPGYDSGGRPTNMKFDVGGLGLLGVFTVKF